MRRIILYLLSGVTVFSVAACERDLVFNSTQKASSHVSKNEESEEAIETGLFSLLELQTAGMESVLAAVEQKQWGRAAQELLTYYRNSLWDPRLNYINPSLTESQQSTAEAILNNQFGEESFQASFGWMPAAGLAYRVLHDESYPRKWIDSYQKWSAFYGEGTGCDTRLENLTFALSCMVNANVLMPSFFTRLLNDISVEAGRTDNARVLGLLATLYPEFKAASAWKEAAGTDPEGLTEPQWFSLLDLEDASMQAVRAAYQARNYQAAAEAFLTRFRSCQAPLISGVDYNNITVTEEQKRWADYALEENGWRFYVKGYWESEGVPFSYAAEDGGINWMRPSTEQEQKYQIHRHQWMIPQAKVYATTGDEKYASSWMAVYSSWMDACPFPTVDLNYGIYPDNLPAQWRYAGWSYRPLEAAIRVLDQMELLHYYRRSSSLTAPYLLRLFHLFGQQVNHIRSHYSTATENHRITEAQAVTAAGILMRDFADAPDWAREGSEELADLLGSSYYEDGFLKDGDLQYHISSIEDFRSVYETARLNGRETVFPETYVEGLREKINVVQQMMFPDYSVPNMADTRKDSWSRSVLKRNFVKYASIFPDDQELTWLATEGGEGVCPETLSADFQDAGYYVMRSGWLPTDRMMVLQNSPYSPGEKWHRQWDPNTFELYSDGRHFITDSGCYTYTTGTERSQYAATSAHNTLTLDGRNVENCHGRMLVHRQKGNTDVLVLENPSYEGLTHRRSIFFVERKWWVIVDEGYGSAEGTVSLNFHLLPGSDQEVVVDIENNGAHTAFTDSNILLRTFSESDKLQTEALQGFYSTQTYQSVARKVCRSSVAKLATEPARFITVIIPGQKVASRQIDASFSEEFSLHRTAVNVSIDSKSYQLFIDF